VEEIQLWESKNIPYFIPFSQRFWKNLV
jgi:hypothetical protein